MTRIPFLVRGSRGVVMAALLVLVWATSGCGGGTAEFVEAAAPQSRADGPTAWTDRISGDRISKLTQQLVQINSEYDYGVVHKHREIADFLAKELRDIGLEVEVVNGGPGSLANILDYDGDANKQDPDFPVVIARLRGSVGKPVLGLITHYNTVVVGNREAWSVDPFAGVIKDGRIYGRGAANSKVGVATDIEIARAIKESGVQLKGDLILLFPPGEGATEFALPWIVENRPELIQADWYFGGSVGGDFTRMHAGHVWFRLVSKGTQLHPPCPPPCVNAVDKLVKVLGAVNDVESWMTIKDDPLFAGRRPFAEVGKIEGGYQVNIVPDRAFAEIDIRTLPNMTFDQVKTDLEGLLARLKKEDPLLDIEVEWIWIQIVPYKDWLKVNEDDLLVRTIMDLAEERLGKRPTWRDGIGGGAGRPDLWRLGSKVIYSGGVPSGIPGGGGAHGIDEWANPHARVPGARFTAEVITKVLQ